MPDRFSLCYTATMKMLDTELLAEVTARLVAEFHPEQIILFGSHAWGTPDEDSDLDLLVIVPRSGLPPHERAARGYRALRGVLLPVEVHVRTRSEFDRDRHVPAYLEAQIAEEGQRLYG